MIVFTPAIDVWIVAHGQLFILAPIWYWIWFCTKAKGS
jgi:hypothetical protein